jgi:hypothetical protein
LREGRHRDHSQSSRSDESLSHGSSFLMVLGARPSRFPVCRASPFLVIVASTTDVAPTHAPVDRSVMCAYSLMQAGTRILRQSWGSCAKTLRNSVGMNCNMLVGDSSYA